mmetsp:Transcript_34084/g.107197  ORF Transcript_34084/g.107197 Transcript_34084/m.107197 type:complete len:84 (+) Transcript_34084:3-254(+)
MPMRQHTHTLSRDMAFKRASPSLFQVTTTRKIFSTVYSVLRNPSNSLDEMQWAGCTLVFAGLAVELLEKALPSKKPAKDPKKL